MNIIIYLLVGIIIAGFLFLLVRTSRDTYITKVVINKPYEYVWSKISDPLNYPSLYPGWIKKVELVSSDHYRIRFPHMDEAFSMKRLINKDAGLIDLHIFLPGKEEPEVSVGRIISIGQNRTAVVHLGVKWKEFNPVYWLIYTFIIDSDFKNAAKVIEAEQ